MVASFLFTSWVLLRPIISQPTAKAAGQLLLSHTAAKTQDSPHTPTEIHPHSVNYMHPQNQKNLAVSALIFLHNMNRLIAVSQHIHYITKLQARLDSKISKWECARIRTHTLFNGREQI